MRLKISMVTTLVLLSCGKKSESNEKSSFSDSELSRTIGETIRSIMEISPSQDEKISFGPALVAANNVGCSPVVTCSKEEGTVLTTLRFACSKNLTYGKNTYSTSVSGNQMRKWNSQEGVDCIDNAPNFRLTQPGPAITIEEDIILLMSHKGSSYKTGISSLGGRLKTQITERHGSMYFKKIVGGELTRAFEMTGYIWATKIRFSDNNVLAAGLESEKPFSLGNLFDLEVEMSGKNRLRMDLRFEQGGLLDEVFYPQERAFGFPKEATGKVVVLGVDGNVIEERKFFSRYNTDKSYDCPVVMSLYNKDGNDQKITDGYDINCNLPSK